LHRDFSFLVNPDDPPQLSGLSSPESAEERTDDRTVKRRAGEPGC
jgi:hypothetical protein